MKEGRPSSWAKKITASLLSVLTMTETVRALHTDGKTILLDRNPIATQKCLNKVKKKYL